VSTLAPRGRPTRRARSRGEAIGRTALAFVALALAFLLGIAFARTLDERPSPGGTETIVRTLTPVPQGAPTRTVTVTVTGP
jgi:hypothetical protein